MWRHNEHAFVHCYLILDRVPKLSTTQSLHLHNPFNQDTEISQIGVLVILCRVEYCLFVDRHVRTMRLPRHSPIGAG